MNSIRKIPVEFFDEFESKIEKLNKKASKLRVDPIEVHILDYVTEKRDGKLEIPCYEVVLRQKSEFKINGFAIVGKLERNINDTFVYYGDSSVPKERKDIHLCEHCNSNRKRNYYYILKTKYEDYITVGRTCLVDYMGHKNADKIAFFYEQVKSFFETYNPFIDDNFKEYSPQVFSIDQVLRLSIASINERGYHKSDDEFTMPTKKHVLYCLENYGLDKDTESTFENALLIPQSEIDEIKEFINNLNDDSYKNSDFLYNAKLLLKDKFVKQQMLGFIVCLPQVVKYQKEKQIKDSLQDKIKEQSSYVGRIGEKIIIPVTFSKSIKLNSSYYYSNPEMLFFLDENNNTIIWKTSTYPNLNVGDKVELKGTVKEHSEYNNLKQTFITRAKVKKID